MTAGIAPSAATPPRSLETAVPFDLLIKNTRSASARAGVSVSELLDIGIADGRIVAIGPALAHDGAVYDARGQLVMPGLVETHIHLDKSCILDRCSICEGNVQEAIRETARAKLAFTEDDIYARARRTLEKAIAGGTQHMRAHTEIDPRIGLKGYRAISQLARDYAWAIDLSLCVFPQEGLTNDPGAEALLIEACELGAGAIGGAPYIDTDPNAQIARIFDLAQRFDLDVDFHLDFDLDPGWAHIDEVCRQTEKHSWGGRVAAGHMTKISALPPPQQIAMAQRLANAGVAVTVIPATDLFLMGRDADHNIPRGVTRADRLAQHGVTASLATNNVMNAFTPFGDASLIRMANLYANIAQLGRPADFEMCMELVSTRAARLMNITDYGIAVGHPADLVVFASDSAANAVAEIAQPRVGFKRGVRTFTHALPELHPPQAG
jgi:cytosine/creatinine deaminase